MIKNIKEIINCLVQNNNIGRIRGYCANDFHEKYIEKLCKCKKCNNMLCELCIKSDKNHCVMCNKIEKLPRMCELCNSKIEVHLCNKCGSYYLYCKYGCANYKEYMINRGVIICENCMDD